MVDFDALVTSGVISEETCNAIKAYMEENKPEDKMGAAPAEDNAPEMGSALAEDEKLEGGLLADLLNAGIITEAEYEAINAA